MELIKFETQNMKKDKRKENFDVLIKINLRESYES